ncbi:hypothetical protein M4I21_18245 [Cellulophaga sp. 20_2_10]|nr:hypothetical protein [Cellulophaga sp. 20_2_10]
MEIKFLNLLKKIYNIMADKILNWQWFRDFFNITIFKYFVTWFALVPIFAKLTEELPEKIKLQLNPEESYTITLLLPFKWEILWVSSLSFVIAYILYIIFSPTFVKRYFSLKDYKGFEHSPRWIVWESQKLTQSKSVDLDKFTKRMVEKNYISKIDNSEDFENKKVLVTKEQTYLMFEYKEENYKFSMPILTDGKEDKNLTEIAVREIFWEIFARFSDSKIVIRFIIQFLLLTSLVTFAIPFCCSIYSGLQYFLK